MMSDMRLEQSQSQQVKQKQSQRLIVSQKHQQAIKLLQYPVQQLAQWARQKYEENPLLEYKENTDEEVVPDNKEVEEEVEDEIADRVDWDELLNKGDDYYYFSHSSGGGEHPEDQFRALATREESLHDSLLNQLELLDLTEKEHKACELIISYIDSDGYFQGDIEQLAEDVEVNFARLEELLEVVQDFDPPGVGGRTLQEVLLLQLGQLKVELPGVTEQIINEHLEDLKKRSYKKIARSVDTSPEIVQRVADLVHELEPRPGRSFEEASKQYLTPDVEVRKVNGEYVVLLNEDVVPPLRINSRYRQMLQGGDPEEEEYVKEKLSGALWILHCIYQRQQTLYKVVESIIKLQRDFFERGIKHLKPLVLKEVADDIDRHESTVSRAVQNKCVQTPRGLYRLNFFFSSGIKAKEGGEKISSTAVKAMIAEIIASEDRTEPLSDSKIKDKLEEEGIQIGRRTVAKYRKQLEIPARNLRKRVTEKTTG
ncbi:MAG: RNA polymerase factor sigma-54 [bacterium]